MVIEVTPQGKRQFRLIFFLLRLNGSYADLRQLGEVYGEPFEFWTRPNRAVRRPDITFLSTDHRDRFTTEGVVGPVDLVVEVVSDDSVVRDTKDKWAEYATAGVPEYWIVEGRENRRGVAFYELVADGSYAEIPPDAHGRLRSKVLSGFWLDPAWLEQDPFPSPLSLLVQIVPGGLRALDPADDSV